LTEKPKHTKQDDQADKAEARAHVSIATLTQPTSQARNITMLIGLLVNVTVSIVAGIHEGRPNGLLHSAESDSNDDEVRGALLQERCSR
jgi:hypothetical protein